MFKSLRVRCAVLAAGLLSIIGVLSYWTEHIARSLAFQRALGPPLELFGCHLYPPWAWVEWAFRFYARVPAIFDPAIQACAPLVFLVLILIAVVRPPRKPSTAHGSARWAEMSDLRRARLLRGEGVVLCQTADARISERKEGGVDVLKHGRLLTDDSDQHVLVVAATGTGKGENTVRPTCYLSKRSLVAIDIKGELFDKTAGYRSQFSHCLKFAPCSEVTVHINPLINVRKGTKEVADVQNIADCLVDPGGQRDKTFWEKSAADLLVGVMLHILYAEPLERKTLGYARRFLQFPGQSLADTFEIMLRTPHLGERPHEKVAECAQAMLNKADKEQASVVSSALACLTIFSDPLVEAATAKSDFQYEDLMHSDSPVSLYLVIPPSDLSRLGPLLRLIISQMCGRLVETLAKPKHRLLLFLDEFAALGKVQFLETSIAYVRGFGIRCMPIVQSVNQLAAIYGERSSILDNCNLRLYFGTNDTQTARQVSDLLGTATIQKKQKRRFSFGQSKQQDVEHEHGRPLLTVGEVVSLPRDEAILFAAGTPPYRGKKIFAFADSRFQGLELLKAPASAEEQTRELPPRRTTGDWSGPPCRRYTPPKKTAKVAANAPVTASAPAGGVVFSDGSEAVARPQRADTPGTEWTAPGVDRNSLVSDFPGLKKSVG